MMHAIGIYIAYIQVSKNDQNNRINILPRSSSRPYIFSFWLNFYVKTGQNHVWGTVSCLRIICFRKVRALNLNSYSWNWNWSQDIFIHACVHVFKSGCCNSQYNYNQRDTRTCSSMYNQTCTLATSLPLQRWCFLRLSDMI